MEICMNGSKSAGSERFENYTIEFKKKKNDWRTTYGLFLSLLEVVV